MSVIKVKNNGKWETIPIIDNTSGSGVGKIDSNSDGTGEIFNDYVNNVASGLKSHSEGNNNKAIGQNAHAEGSSTKAIGPTTHTEGNNTIAYQNNSHAEGSNGIAFGQASHAEGLGETKVYGKFSITVNASTKSVTFTTIENYLNPDEEPEISAALINNICKFEGNDRLYTVQNIEGINGTLIFDTVTGLSDGEVIMQTYNHYAKGPGSHVEGNDNITTAGYAHVEGNNNTTTGSASHVEGSNNKVGEEYAHAEGYRNTANGVASHVEGVFNSSSGTGSHAEGYKTTASGQHAHSENLSTVASGAYTHAEGDNTIASGQAAHAEGRGVVAKGSYSHAEGQRDLTVEAPFFSKTRNLKIYRSSSQYVSYVDDSSEFQFILSAGELFKHSNTIYKVKEINYNNKSFSTSPNIVDNIELSSDYSTPTEITIEPVTKLGTAIGDQSHHEGTNNCAYGTNSHVGGNECQAIGNNSFVHGENLIAGDGQTVFGKYNLYNEDDLFQIGYGIDQYKGRANALSVDNDGVTTTSYIKTYGITVSDKLISWNNITIGNSTTNWIVNTSKGLIITDRGNNEITNDGASGDTTYLIVGESNNVSGRSFLIVGSYNNANHTFSNNSICVGLYNTICDSQSITVGYNCIAYGNATVAFGGGGIILTIGNKDATSLLQLYESTYNEREDSIHVAFAKQSMVTGKNNLALGLQSMSNGQGNVAKNDQEFVVGSFNDYSSDTNNLFVVGNGTSHTSRSNAFVVTRDGVQNSSDINLKDNITDLKPKGELRLVEFDWKNTGRHSYGFIAQEVEQIYPEMVSDNGQHKMLNYNEAICAKIAELQNRIVELEKLIQK